MKLRHISISFIAILVSCSSSDDAQQNINSPLLGAWETQACDNEPDTIMLSTDKPWEKGTYEFMPNGDIFFTSSGYQNSTCTLSAGGIASISSTIDSFKDQGEVTLEEGILGNRVNITTNFSLGIFSANGFYTINNNTLCFSHSYIFETTGLGILLDERPPIDFTTCLTPKKQP